MISHDESRAFNVLYIVLAVVLSVFVSLFWLVVIVDFHFVLELARQHSHCPDCLRKAVGGSFWNLKLDMSFIAFSFAVSAYLGVLFGMAGLGGISRVGRVSQVGVRSGAGIGAYESAVRGIMLSVDDVARTTTTAIAKRNDKKSDNVPEDNGVEEEWATAFRAHVPEERLIETETVVSDVDMPVKWTRNDYATIAFGGICVVLLFLTPVLIGLSYPELFQIIIQDLQPFPMWS